jgi:preprotein translocase subunit YajC
MGPLLILILLFVVMYAAMIRPQQKRAREHQALIAAVQVGDEVMTTAGIFGTVTDVEGDVISVEISPGTVMRVARAGIGRRLTAELEELDARETFDDIDDELGDSVADETAPTNGSAVGNDSGSTDEAPPTVIETQPAPSVTPPPPVAPPPPVTPPAPEAPPTPPGTGPASPGPGPGSTEPG